MSNSSLLLPIFHSLEKTSQEVGYRPEELLLAASEGSMEVMFGLPGNLHCRIIQTGEYDEEILSDRPTKVHPDFFTLSRPQCLRLMIGGSALVKMTRTAYTYSQSRGFTRIVPEHPDTYAHGAEIPATGTPGLTNQHWAFFENEDRTACLVKKDMIYIQGEEIFKFTRSMEPNLYRYSPENFPAEMQRQALLREHESMKLDLLNLAASKFWFQPHIIRGNNSSHPYTEDIEEWFIKNGFKADAAKFAARFIRPKFAGAGRRRKPD